ncbi:MAG: non-heme iron oxygenase ferredoxin subunit [Chloroflexota bacterium]|nr:non-heme iron oxygenase ferredoxin subunit [Chloroflexota bacterium]MDE2941298.1 non-heme iron oxygenase ferredoxin subunit [Chloroflexota bacterium]MDE3267770.1 non-heme iron oxygenase ferredoxin subunit [Chloroflexota bacterium]
MADFVRVASISDVSPGAVMLVDVDGERIALVNVDGELYAVADECSHEGCSLSEGDVDGRMLVCPCHGSDFDVTTGEPASPPAYESVATYAVRVDGDDVLVQPSD